jgi:hypothetical protein
VRELSSLAGHTVIPPSESLHHVGLTYSDIFQDLMQWFVSEKPDENNNARIVFIRGVDFPAAGQAGYGMVPATFIGTRALRIFDSQYIFLPLIYTAATDLDFRATTVQERKYVAERDTKAGDNPPTKSQVLIDGKEIEWKGNDLSDFHFWTPDFPLTRPNIQYGRLLCDYFDIPFAAPGTRFVSAEGYCILFKFNPPPAKKEEMHTVIFEARGVPGGPGGQYTSKGVYTITVTPSIKGIQSSTPRTLGVTEIFKASMRSVIEKERKDGRLGEGEYTKLISDLQ